MVSSELIPAPDLEADANTLAVKWLHGYTTANTRNAYARAIGLDARLRAALPGGPRDPRPSRPPSWIPWALAAGIDPAGELTVEHVQSWVHALNETFEDRKNSRRQYFAALCAFYRYLRSVRRVYCDPNDLVNRRTMGLSGADPTATLALSPLQVRALLLAARLDTTAHRVRNVALVAVLAATGCRVDELVGLDVDDYRRESPAGPALVLLDGKGDKKRWQKLPAADADLVDGYLEHERVAPETGAELTVVGQVSNRKTDQPLFTTGRGRRLHPDTVAPLLNRLARLPTVDDPRQQVRDAARELAPVAGKIRPHQFRHAYAVTAERNGATVTQVQADLGHASLSTTQTYLHAANVGSNSAAQVVSDIYHAGEDLAALFPADPVGGE